MSLNRDPWQSVRTIHDFPADEIISALQKEIRRGHTENSALIAFEMATTSPELEAYLWKRLQVIAVEDIGFGDPTAPVLIHTLAEMVKELDRQDGERLLYSVHAVRYLCAARKDRSSDEMINWIMRAVEKEGVRPVVPDYSLDMHTGRGQQMGRKVTHFIEEGAKVEPEWAERDRTYRDRLLELLRKEDA
jgi:replication-associated recombination protein RarA